MCGDCWWTALSTAGFRPPSRFRCRCIPGLGRACVAQGAEGPESRAVPQRGVGEGRPATERLLVRWRDEPDARRAEVIDRYWLCAAAQGMHASTFTGRVVASTGAAGA